MRPGGTRRQRVRRLVLVGFLLAPLLLILSWATVSLWPDPAINRFLERPYSPVILASRGELLRKLPLEGGLWREKADLERLPTLLVSTFRKSEDERYYLHPGVDPVSLLRAAFQNARAGEIVSGGSTITMQLARTISPHAGGIAGKVGEALRALRLEARLTKDEILGAWLNSIPFGSQVEGVASASDRIFGVSPAELSTEQILLLSVIPRRPTRYDPRRNPGEAARAALQLAARLGIPVREEQLLRAANESSDAAAATRGSAGADPGPAPHFVRFLANSLSDAELAAGSTVQATIDLDVQRALSAAIRARVSGADEFRISNGAGIVIENGTGRVLAWTGSADFDDEESSGQIDGVRIARQPGSTLKPFLYALALENGFSAATILPDIPAEFGGAEIYVPENFNNRFNGPVRLRTALASSLNVPAVHTLERLGVSSFAEYLLSLGFDSLESQMQSVGTGLALGNAEVTLLELTRAFSVFVNDGLLRPVRFRDDRTDHAEQKPGAQETRVMSRSTAGIIRSILSDELSRVPGFGTRSILDTDFEAMFKTGTSNQFNNIWALGSTATMTVGVWMGNFSGETVIGKPGSSLPAAAVIEVLGLFAARGERLPGIDGVRTVEICATSGLRANESCPAVIPEYFTSGDSVPLCNWHTGPLQPVRYPPEYQSWALERDYLVQPGAAASSSLRIVRPADGAVFYHDPTIDDESQAVGVEVISGGDEIEIYLDGSFYARGPSPLVVTLPVRRGEFLLTATSGDQVASSAVSIR